MSDSYTRPSTIVKTFYGALKNRDADTMASYYAPNASFSDEIFVGLNGIEAGQMWKMLCSRSKDLKITFQIQSESESQVITKWEAEYTFTKTNRPVRNSITSVIAVKDGKIISHQDSFDFRKWSAQALGMTGVFLGWTRFLKSKVRAEARRSLRDFAAKA